MTMTRAEQVQSRGNEGIRALSVPRPWATGAPAIRPVNGQRINCLGDWIGRSGKDRNRAQETAWEALLSATTPAARPASREAVASRIPSFGNREGKIPGVPEEPEPEANHARLLSPAKREKGKIRSARSYEASQFRKRQD